MHPKRLRRIPLHSYAGEQRYSLTICAYEGRSLFENATLANCVRTYLLQTADDCRYEVIAYCIMPDHMHVLAHGMEGCDTLDVFMKRMKQLSGFHGKRIINGPVWQTGYFERVLREWEDSRVVAAYILDNPVRRGLVANAADYPLSGSGSCTLQELIDFIQIRPT